MTVLSDYVTGTITLTNGSDEFTGAGTGWAAAGFLEGDTIIDLPGTPYQGVVATIDGNGAGTLTKAWEGPTLTGVAYRLRYQPDGSRVTAQARTLVELLGNGNLVAFAGLTGAADMVPMFTGPGALTLEPRTSFISGAFYNVQVDELADRAAYDDRLGPDGDQPGFAVLVSDIGDGSSAIYSKLSDASADWSAPAIMTGATGAPGATGTSPELDNVNVTSGATPSGAFNETSPGVYDLDLVLVPGADGADGLIVEIVEGANITVDATDPARPIISSTASGVPPGGTTGQVLTKQSNADGDADWEGPHTVAYAYAAAGGTSYTLPAAPPTDAALTVVIDGVVQPKDGSAYTYAGTALELTDDPLEYGGSLVEMTVYGAPLVYGSVPAGSIGATELADAAVTNAKLDDMPTARLKGRATAGAGEPEDITISAALNMIAGAADGDILTRVAGAWVRLALGAAKRILRSNAAGTALEYVAVSRGPDVILEDQKPQNTSGGTFTAGADQIRVLNTEVHDPNGYCTLAGNQFTLGAGTWFVAWAAPAYAVAQHQSFLYNVTDAAVVKRSMSMYCGGGVAVMNVSTGSAIVTIAGSKAFEIRHRGALTSNTDGFGVASNFGVETYTRVEITRVDP